MLSRKAFMPIESHTNLITIHVKYYTISYPAKPNPVLLMRHDLLMSSRARISYDGLLNMGVCQNETLSVEVNSWLSDIVSDNS